MDEASTSRLPDDHEDSESERELEPPSSKRKSRGSAVYNTKYDVQWRRKYRCIRAVKGDPFSFSCIVCQKVVSCKHMGIGDVKRHIEAVGHKKATKSIEKQPKLSFVPDPVQTKVR